MSTTMLHREDCKSVCDHWPEISWLSGAAADISIRAKPGQHRGAFPTRTQKRSQGSESDGRTCRTDYKKISHLRKGHLDAYLY